MSFVGQIGFQLDQLAQNIARLQEQAAVLPERSEIVRVDGATQEHAQQRFYKDLSRVSFLIAETTQQVRGYVERNAAAFEQAAANLQETDGADSLAARRADAFVQGIVSEGASPAGTASSAGGTSPAGTNNPGADDDTW